MRSLQVLATGTLASAASVVVPFTALRTKVGGKLANLEAITIRLSKGAGSTVRPYTATVKIRDSEEVLFDSNGTELLMQQRERGESIVCQLGSGSATDACLLKWRPGYGADEADMQQAAGLFQGGDITITAPADGGQTTTYEVVAHLALGDELRVPSRCVTRTLGASAREQAGNFLVASVRDQSFSAGASYTVETGQREIFTSVTGTILQQESEASLGPAGDPVTLTAVAASTLASPNFIRAAMAGSSDYRLPPLSKLPESDGVLRLTAGFVGAPLTTVIYPRSAAEVRARMEAACNRAGIPFVKSLKAKTRHGGPFNAAHLAPYFPITGKA
jgi:hypothetical protein